MKRVVVSVAALVFLGTTTLGCMTSPYTLEADKTEVAVGEPVRLTVYDTVEDRSAEDDIKFSISGPAGGASIQNGVFVASTPGSYTVALADWRNRSVKIVVTQAGVASEIFNTGNGGAIDGGGTPPEFTIKKPIQITELTTYHDTESVGGIAHPGTIAIKAEDGTVFGPFQATGSEGQGGDANAYWIVKPEGLVLPPGTYTVIDSDPKSFAQNDESQGAGMAWMSGAPQT
jgi:hypothetical protein